LRLINKGFDIEELITGKSKCDKTPANMRITVDLKDADCKAKEDLYC